MASTGVVSAANRAQQYDSVAIAFCEVKLLVVAYASAGERGNGPFSELFEFRATLAPLLASSPVCSQ